MKSTLKKVRVQLISKSGFLLHSILGLGFFCLDDTTAKHLSSCVTVIDVGTTRVLSMIPSTDMLSANVDNSL